MGRTACKEKGEQAAPRLTRCKGKAQKLSRSWATRRRAIGSQDAVEANEERAVHKGLARTSRRQAKRQIPVSQELCQRIRKRTCTERRGGRLGQRHASAQGGPAGCTKGSFRLTCGEGPSCQARWPGLGFLFLLCLGPDHRGRKGRLRRSLGRLARHNGFGRVSSSPPKNSQLLSHGEEASPTSDRSKGECGSFPAARPMFCAP